MRLSVKSLTTGLDFHGEVQGKRQHYYVLSSARQYFVMSVSRSKRGAGYFNLVSRTAANKLYRRLRGQKGLTAKVVFTRSRNKRLVPSRPTAAGIARQPSQAAAHRTWRGCACGASSSSVTPRPSAGWR